MIRYLHLKLGIQQSEFSGFIKYIKKEKNVYCEWFSMLNLDANKSWQKCIFMKLW